MSLSKIKTKNNVAKNLDLLVEKIETELIDLLNNNSKQSIQSPNQINKATILSI